MEIVMPQVTPEPGTAVHVQLVIERLRQVHPDAHCELNYETPLQLLIAVILSAQCTDVRVNKVTPALFARYQTAADFAGADRSELEELVHPTGFFRQKARFIQECCQRLLHSYGGVIPDNMDDLLTLTGVARKTANVVLGEIYGIAEGITVDTHIKRLSGRLGWSSGSSPQKVEKDLMQIIPKESWIEIAHLLIFHGRRVCDARKPDCPNCTLNDVCPSADL